MLHHTSWAWIFLPILRAGRKKYLWISRQSHMHKTIRLWVPFLHRPGSLICDDDLVLTFTEVSSEHGHTLLLYWSSFLKTLICVIQFPSFNCQGSINYVETFRWSKKHTDIQTDDNKKEILSQQWRWLKGTHSPKSRQRLFSILLCHKYTYDLATVNH